MLQRLALLATFVVAIGGCGGSSPSVPSSLSTPKPSPSPPVPPNIVVILADDLGYGDLSAYGNTLIRTPNIDTLAERGVRFTHASTPVPICAPSRASFLTGHLPSHTGVRWNPPNVLREGEVMIAQALRDLGYATGLAGKWHIEGYTPQEKGFDWADWVFNGPDDANHGFAEWYTQSALAWIREQKAQSRPFFMYVSHYDPHQPLSTGTYKDTVEWLDKNVGDLLNGLRDLGLEENTIVVFLSDNGPPRNIGFRGPLYGNKGECFEGGLRVPALVRWPLKIPANRVASAPVSLLDFFPTLLKFANVNNRTLPDYRHDGMDVSRLLTGDADLISGPGIGGGRELLFWGNNGVCALRSGRMKYLRAGYWQLFPALYDLEADPGENVNLIKALPTLAEQMSERLLELERSQ